MISTGIDAERFEPKMLIAYLKSEFGLRAEYDTPVGVDALFTLEDHTLAVMNAYEKYFKHLPLDGGVTRGWFRVLLALHDVGKPKAIALGDKKLQHGHTLEIIHNLKDKMHFSTQEIQWMLELLHGDPLGEYLKGVLMREDSRALIYNHAHRAGLEKKVFFRLLTVYYQCDILSYTSLAKIIKALDFLFKWKAFGEEVEWNHTEQRLQFSDAIEQAYIELKELI